ncbi:enoyl-CoA hydratase-related protein [Sinimarinibacterium flocculans]|uniref:Enoyl-CoA hydratase n=1 Tax=Sinimarinibacterium flocculans TaxID=985250 RepID=A0A318EFV2_9GAMM|nr:enoyl-CoA hydratase-related protein [Sinimarinibacterium flocculans]PXV71657.1 enoyl-CoA hydratase [Sinimarinibacterium flocculans]
MSKEQRWKYVRLDRDGDVAIVTLNRPDRLNALSADVMDGLEAHLGAVATDPAVRAVLLRAEGRSFCAGGDIKSGNLRRDERGRLVQAEKAARLRAQTNSVLHLHTMPKPTVSAMRGAAVGAGAAIGLAADFRLGSTSLKISMAYSKIGLSSDFGGSYFLTLWAGAAVARRLMLDAAPVTSEEALQLGLINQIMSDDGLDYEALTLAKKLAAGPTAAYAHMKHSLNLAASGAPLESVLDAEAQAVVELSESPDHQEAVKAFMERRLPAFKGR